MNKFKIGDRAVFYNGGERYTGHVSATRGQLLIINTDCDSGPSGFINVHHKQCRKLKPKQKRVIWVPRGDDPVALTDLSANAYDNDMLTYLTTEPLDKCREDFVRLEYTEPKREK